MDKHIENKKNILVHCKAGHRRSVCLIAYYLMKKYGVSRAAALKHIHGIRPTVHTTKNKILFYNSLK